MNSSKDDALAQVANASKQLEETKLLKNSNDRNPEGLIRADARKAARTATALADAAARRAGATDDEIRFSRDV